MKVCSICRYCIAMVWFVNGLFCKVLHLVPRHEQIVARILGCENAGVLTVLIGLSEMAMSAWILSGFRPQLNAWVQIALIAAMNILEYGMAPDLLLWGRLNTVFAAMFIGFIYITEFILPRKPGLKPSHEFPEKSPLRG